MTRTQPRRAIGVAAGLAALATAAVLAGCSGDDPSRSPTSAPASSPSTTASASETPGPEESPSETAAVPTVAEVYRAARTAALSAASGRAEGSQTREGRTLKIEVEGTANGSNQTVFISSKGGTAEVLTVGDSYWLGGDEAFWVEQTGDQAAGAGMVGKYVPIAESDATELGSFTLRSILTEKFALPEFAAFESDGTPAQETELDGRAAYVLGEEGGARLWVASDGSGALLRAIGPKTAPSDLVFSEWGRAEKFAAPPASTIVENG